MVDVRDFDEHRAWLKTQPREIVTLLAARNGLRVFPIMRGLLDLDDKHDPQTLILPGLWAMATAIFAKNWAAQPLSISAYAADASRAAANAGNAAVATNANSANALYSAAYAANAAALPVADAAENGANAAARAANALLYAAPSTTQDDVDYIFLGNAAPGLDRLPLWSERKMPLDLKKTWANFKSELWTIDKTWRVWTDWYDTLLKGNAPMIEEIEIGDPENGKFGRATFPPGMYKDPPKLNAALAKVIDEYWAGQAGSIPKPNPASIRTVWKNGHLHIDFNPLDPDIEAALALENLLALKDEIVELAKAIRQQDNIDKRPADYIQNTADMITGEMPDSRTLFRFVRREALLLDYEKTVKEQWPDFIASQYSSLCTELSNVLDMFADRRVFKRQQISAEIEEQGADEIIADISNRVEIMQHGTGKAVVSSDIPETIDAIVQDYDSSASDVTTGIILTDAVDSTNNVLKALANKALTDQGIAAITNEIDKGYVQGMGEGLIEGAKEAGHSDGKKAAKAIARAHAGKAAGQALSDKLPKSFGWLKRLPFID